MKVNTKYIFQDFITGKELTRMTEEEVPQKVPLTFGFIAAQSLLADLQGESGKKGDKVKQYGLARKCFESEEIDLSLDEAALILERSEKGYPPIIAGQVEKLLNGHKEA